MAKISKHLARRLRRWRRGARRARRTFADTAGGSDRRRRRDPLAIVPLTQPRLSGDPQADRVVLLRRPPPRQGAGRDVAAIRGAVPHLFHRHDHARIAGRAGAGREFGQSGRPHLLALALQFQSVRDLSARLQRRRPVPDDRSGLRGGRAVLYPGQRGHGYRLRLRSLDSRDPEPCRRARHRCIWTAMFQRCSTAPDVAATRSRSRIWPPSSISAAPAPPPLSRADKFQMTARRALRRPFGRGLRRQGQRA